MEIRRLTPADRPALSSLLRETVAGGGSVSFLHPLAQADADAFWDDVLAAAARGERIILGAFRGDMLAGTVTLVLKTQPNAPHRAEIAKMMTAVGHRRQGVAKALLAAAERLALEHGKRLLVLDTAQDAGAAFLYETQDYRLAGIIPGYALKPHGGLTATLVYYKQIG